MNSYTRYYKCPPLFLSLSQTHTHSHTETQLSFSLSQYYSTLFSFCHHCLDTWGQNPKQTPHVHCIWTGVYSLIIFYAIVFFGYIFSHYLRLLIFDHLILLAFFHSLSLTWSGRPWTICTHPPQPFVLFLPSVAKLASAISWAHQTPSPLSLCSELFPLLGMFICNISD